MEPQLNEDKKTLSFEQYRRLSIRTLPEQFVNKQYKLKPDKNSFEFAKMLDLVHMQMGVVTETYEQLNAENRVNFGEEIADKAWYLSGWLYVKNNYEVSTTPVNVYYFKKTLTHEQRFKELLRLDEMFLDDAKKMLVYKREPKITILDVEAYITLLVDYCVFYGYNFDELLYRNIEKLKVRYPDSFTTERALNRNLKKEKSVL